MRTSRIYARLDNYPSRRDRSIKVLLGKLLQECDSSASRTASFELKTVLAPQASEYFSQVVNDWQKNCQLVTRENIMFFLRDRVGLFCNCLIFHACIVHGNWYLKYTQFSSPKAIVVSCIWLSSICENSLMVSTFPRNTSF